MPHWLSGLCQMACFLMQPMNAFTCYLFAIFAFLTESFLACNFICLYFVYCSLLCVCVCVWFFFLNLSGRSQQVDLVGTGLEHCSALFSAGK